MDDDFEELPTSQEVAAWLDNMVSLINANWEFNCNNKLNEMWKFKDQMIIFWSSGSFVSFIGPIGPKIWKQALAYICDKNFSVSYIESTKVITKYYQNMKLFFKRSHTQQEGEHYILGMI